MLGPGAHGVLVGVAVAGRRACSASRCCVQDASAGERCARGAIAAGRSRARGSPRARRPRRRAARTTRRSTGAAREPPPAARRRGSRATSLGQTSVRRRWNASLSAVNRTGSKRPSALAQPLVDRARLVEVGRVEGRCGSATAAPSTIEASRQVSWYSSRRSRRPARRCCARTSPRPPPRAAGSPPAPARRSCRARGRAVEHEPVARAVGAVDDAVVQVARRRAATSTARPPPARRLPRARHVDPTRPRSLVLRAPRGVHREEAVDRVARVAPAGR